MYVGTHHSLHIFTMVILIHSLSNYLNDFKNTLSRVFFEITFLITSPVDKSLFINMTMLFESVKAIYKDSLLLTPSKFRACV